MADNSPPGSERTFIRRVLILLGILAAVGLLYVLRHIVMLVFGSVVIGVLLSAMSDPIRRWTGLPRGLSLALAILILLVLIGGAAASFGSQVVVQGQQLAQMLPDAWDQFRGRLLDLGISLPDIGAGTSPATTEGPRLPAPGPFGQDLIGRVVNLLRGVFQGVANTLLLIVGGIYLAAQPDLYRRGLLTLFPEHLRGLIGDAYDHSGRALKLWLLGTLISMCVVGLLTWIGLLVIGVPSALALALLAFVLEFVPFIGPVAAATPAILIASTHGVETAIWTTLLFFAVQQLEGNVVQPLAQRYAVDLPPAILLFSLVAVGSLFGVLGIIFAAPLTVVGYVLLKRLYVREALHTPTRLPDEPR